MRSADGSVAQQATSKSNSGLALNGGFAKSLSAFDVIGGSSAVVAIGEIVTSRLNGAKFEGRFSGAAPFAVNNAIEFLAQNSLRQQNNACLQQIPHFVRDDSLIQQIPLFVRYDSLYVRVSGYLS